MSGVVFFARRDYIRRIQRFGVTVVVLLAALALPGLARASAQQDLEQRLGPQGVVDIDPQTRTPRVVARLDGTLTGPASGAAATIGLRYVRANRAAFGLTEADLATLGEPRVTSEGGIRHVRWPQVVNGVEASDSELRVNVTNDGRVLSVLGSPSTNLPTDTTPARPAPRADAELTIYAERLAWRYTDEASPDAVYDVVVDADTGKVLKRSNLVKSLKVWDHHPSLEVAPKDVTMTAPHLTSATTLLGQWVHAYSDTNGNDVADANEEVQPRNYDLQANLTSPGCTTAKPCSWDGTTATRLRNREQNAVQAFYLANQFRDHLAAPPIGFEFHNGHDGVDRLLLETSDASGTNNANMYTPPAGKSPRMQMFLWTGSYRHMNSGDDASILYHEYAHGLTGRLVVDAAGVGALNTAQAAAMAEGWSDFYAKDYLVERGLEPDTLAVGQVHMGSYTDRNLNTIRRQAMDCPVGPSDSTLCPGRAGKPGGFTYGDFGRIGNGPQVHWDGEIWGETLWDLRRVVGPEETRRLVSQALRLTPPEPTFLDARNAILVADAESGGGNRDLIWQVFARRGMGFYASTIDGGDTAPVEDNALPPANGPRAAITGRVTDDLSGAPVAGVTVSVGGQSTGPDALAATTNADGEYTIAGVPVRSYKNVLVRGPGYDTVVVRDVDVTAAGATVDATVRRDWASVAGGAKVVSTAGTEYADIGCGPAAALDGLQATTWSTPLAAGSPKPLVVELAARVDVTQVGIDPSAGCMDPVSAAMGQYTVEVASRATGPWKEIAAGTFGIGDRNRLNFVGQPANGVSHVRLTPKTAQGGSYIDVSEFRVYGRSNAGAIVFEDAPPALGRSGTVRFEFSGGGTYSCQWSDRASAEPCASPVTRTLPDGDYTFTVAATNGAGVDPTPAAHTFKVDSTPPALGISSATATGDRATFAFSATDATAVTYRCTFRGTTAPCTSPKIYDSLPDGGHTLVVTARDAAGNEASAAGSVTISVPAPDTQITAAPGALIARSDATFEFGSPAVATFECSLDGAAFTACWSPFTATGLRDGAHTLAVRAVGTGGRRDATPATAGFTVDTTPPETILTWAPPAILTAPNASVHFTASEPATFACSVDGVEAPCQSPLVLTGLADGAHSVTVLAVDPAGNADPTPARSLFTVATLVPGPPPPEPAPKPALTAATTAKTASLKTLRKSSRVRVTLRAPAGAKVALQAKLGSRVVGKATKTVRGSSTTVQLTLDKRRVRSAKAGATLQIRVRATGVGLTAASKTLKVKLKR